MALTKREVLWILNDMLPYVDKWERQAIEQAISCVQKLPEKEVNVEPFTYEDERRAVRERAELAEAHGLKVGYDLLEYTVYVYVRDDNGGGEWFVPVKKVLEVFDERK